MSAGGHNSYLSSPFDWWTSAEKRFSLWWGSDTLHRSLRSYILGSRLASACKTHLRCDDQPAGQIRGNRLLLYMCSWWERHVFTCLPPLACFCRRSGSLPVKAGGAGACSRWALNQAPFPASFPHRYPRQKTEATSGVHHIWVFIAHASQVHLGFLLCHSQPLHLCILISLLHLLWFLWSLFHPVLITHSSTCCTAPFCTSHCPPVLHYLHFKSIYGCSPSPVQLRPHPRVCVTVAGHRPSAICQHLFNLLPAHASVTFPHPLAFPICSSFTCDLWEPRRVCVCAPSQSALITEAQLVTFLGHINAKSHKFTYINNCREPAPCTERQKSARLHLPLLFRQKWS